MNFQDSKKESLTNISEWHNNNFNYWYERQSIAPILIGSIVISIFSIYIFALFLFRLGFLSELWRLIVAVSGTISITLLIINILMFSYHRKLPLRRFYQVFSRSISIDFLVEEKLAICRDYAKLAACLLFNIYPQSEIYFVKAISHVATGIVVEKKLYIIDKYLPITTIEKWHKRWHKNRFSGKGVELVKGTYLETGDLNILLSQTRTIELDKDKLANTMERLLGIRRSTDDLKQVLSKIYNWKKGAILYEDDEIVNYSLAQRLKQRISNEIIDLSRVISVEVHQNNDDLVFWVSLK